MWGSYGALLAQRQQLHEESQTQIYSWLSLLESGKISPSWNAVCTSDIHAKQVPDHGRWLDHTFPER